MSVVDDFQKANQTYAASFKEGDLPLPPAKKVAILTCMDARIHPAKALGLNLGDAHVIRNAGGRASTDALRSLIISEQLLATDTIVVIHHTDCGMLTFSNQDLRDKLQQEFHASADNIDFLPFKDLEQSVRDDIATIKASPFIPSSITVAGFIYDVHTGQIHPVS
jgi:carbonic anhydrase